MEKKKEKLADQLLFVDQKYWKILMKIDQSFIILAVVIVVLFLFFCKGRKENFSCGGCGGPSYLHSPWRITYDCGMVKYA